MGVKYRCEGLRHPPTDTPKCPLCEARVDGWGTWLGGIAILLIVLAALLYPPAKFYFGN